MDSDLVQILLDIKADVAETKAAVQALAGEGGRVTTLEEDLKAQARFQKWYNYAIIPALASLHEVARYLGIKI